MPPGPVPVRDLPDRRAAQDLAHSPIPVFRQHVLIHQPSPPTRSKLSKGEKISFQDGDVKNVPATNGSIPPMSPTRRPFATKPAKPAPKRDLKRLEQRRMTAAAMFADGATQAQVARELGVSARPPAAGT